MSTIPATSRRILVTLPRLAILFTLFLSLGTPLAHADDPGRMKVEQLDGRFRITIGGELFGELIYEGYAKPIFYPLLGPDQVPMMRNFPVRKGVKGEATDHPHHKSLWFAHGDVNGESFWLEKGKIVHAKTVKVDDNPRRVAVTCDNRWVDHRGKTVCTDTTTVSFSEVPGGRVIDYDVTIHASEGDVLFGDTKEGLMAVRVHPNLQLKNDAKGEVTTANGQVVNSRGTRGDAAWGQRADWVDYFGRIDDKPVGLAMFDHPANLRHPTYWHARDYGLVAANPFGASDFTGHKHAGGEYKLPAGSDLRFRYRIILHRGDTEQAKVQQLYEQYSRETAADK